jgi:iron complex transport system ATP-binding protein
MLAARELSVVASGRFLLREVSCALGPGELLAVVGPNGAGKSTLLKVLCGDIAPSAGEVALEGRPLRSWKHLEQARRRAVLPQESSLGFPFTALEVALMGRHPHLRGAESAHDVAIAHEALELARARQLADRLYPTLSGGEKQRVQLSRVLAQIWEVPESGSRYLLLDEPTNNLDLAHQHGLLQVAKRLAREGAGVFAVLHDLNLAAQYADRLLLLQAGRVAAVGAPHEVITEALIGSVFATPVVVTRHPCLDCPLVVSAVGAPEGGEAYALR